METFYVKFFSAGCENRDLAMILQAADVDLAKARFIALWNACSDLAACAALLDGGGEVIWGAERKERT